MKRINTVATIFFAVLSANAGVITDYYDLENVRLPETLLKTNSGAIQVDGLDFFPDGRLAACFVDGQVYTMSPQSGEWTLFAEGLHTPLGIAILNNYEMVVCQRPEVTILKDTNRDGVADEYEVLTDAFGISGNYHEFNFGPVRDKDGNFFVALGTASSGAGVRYEKRGEFNPLSYMDRMYSCVPYRGWVLKITRDGRTLPWASGLRTPNGLGFDLEGNLFVTDNQGDWVGTSKMHHIEKGKFYGHAASLIWQEGWEGRPLNRGVEELDKLRTPSAILFPHGLMANSPSQPLVDSTNGQFGPFEGQILVGEMNKGRIMRVAMEKVEGTLQGMCIPFFDGAGLHRGNNRLVFGPDNALWVGHSNHGWAGDKGLQKLTWKGTYPPEIHSIKIQPHGFLLNFTFDIVMCTGKTGHEILLF
jgi:sugar lactone lactonase YvrE